MRRYEEVPGIALEVGADALATLARSASVSNVLLDRPTVKSAKDGLRESGQRETAVENEASMAQESVPWQLFNQWPTMGLSSC